MRALCIWMLIFSLSGLSAQPAPSGSYIKRDGSLAEGVFDDQIKTVQFHQTGQELTCPIYALGQSIPLELNFDLLSAQYRNLWLTVVHCDAGWKPSRMSFNEYLGGFDSCPITDYSFSFNTHIPYVHYQISIPNREMTLKLSGNYVLIVYENNKEQPVLTRRFTVVESLVNIQAEVVMPSIPSFQRTAQQVNVVIRHPGIEIRNPQEEIMLCILKNNRWEEAYTQWHPTFVRTNELDYRSAQGILFAGGNEFRHFTTKNLISPLGIRELISSGGMPQFILLPDSPLPGASYSFSEDLDGAFAIRAENRKDPDKEAEYVQVNFSVSPQDRMRQDPLFVVGAFNDFQRDEKSQLQFDSQRNEYLASVILKQGFYDYQYVFGAGNPLGTKAPENGFPMFQESTFDGNHFETENEYTIYVYYRSPSSRYDRIIGFLQIRSSKEGARYNQSGALLKEIFQQRN